MSEKISKEASHLEPERCDEFKDRINILAKRLGGSSQLARLSGVSESVVRKWKSGSSEPTLSRLKAIAEAGNVSIEWLATGAESNNERTSAILGKDDAEHSRKERAQEWSRKVSVAKELVNRSFSNAGLHIDQHWKDMIAAITEKYGLDAQSIDDIASLVRSEADITSEFALIPGYRIEVSAGPGSAINDDKPTRYLAFRHKWLRFRHLKPDNLALVFARGDSMEPTIHDNNTVMIDTSQTELVDGSIYVIRTDNHLVVKRVQKLINKGVLLLSDNKEYKEQMLEASEANDLAVIGRVVWIGKDL